MYGIEMIVGGVVQIVEMSKEGEQLFNNDTGSLVLSCNPFHYLIKRRLCNK